MRTNVPLADLKSMLPQGMTSDKMSEIKELLLASPNQVECPVMDHFADGQYVREVFMSAGMVVLGHVHKKSTVNILLQGRVLIYNGEESPLERLDAPHVYTTEAGVQKLAYVLEDVTWLNCFPTSETDTTKIIEAHTVVSNETFKELS